jgi:hypothetical protein
MHTFGAQCPEIGHEVSDGLVVPSCDSGLLLCRSRRISRPAATAALRANEPVQIKFTTLAAYVFVCLRCCGFRYMVQLCALSRTPEDARTFGPILVHFFHACNLECKAVRPVKDHAIRV